MKKLLSLIGAISIVGSGVSTVVGCGDDFSKPKNNDQEKANAIKDKIKKFDLTVENLLPKGTENSETIKAIKTALQEENPTLTAKDLAKISFEETTLTAGRAVTVKATITVNKAKAFKDLNVTLAQTNQQKADAIKEKIINDTLIVVTGTNPNITNNETITAIKTVLQEANQSLTDADLATITFTGKNLEVGTGVTVTATITVGTEGTVGTAKKDLNVTLAKSDQQQANAIKGEISNPNLNVPTGTNADTTNAGTIAAIKKALQSKNPSLTTDDLMKIEFSSATLRPFTSVRVVATITVGTATATRDLNVTLVESDKQKAERIKDKIINVNLDIPGSTNPDTTNTATIAAIKTALQSENTNLTDEDLVLISFSDTTLQSGTSVVVKATVTVGSATAEKDLNVILAQSDQQQADAIKAKIRDVNLTVPVGTPTDTSNQATVDEIKIALANANALLSISDLAAINSFSLTTLQAGVATPVIANITVGVASAQKDLNVTLAQTDQQKADAIKAKISNVDLNIPAGLSTATTDPATLAAIKTALQADNPNLTTSDVSAITSLDSATLIAGSPVAITANITVGSGRATINLNVTLAQTDQQKANAIKDKITMVNVEIGDTLNTDTTNPQTIAAIRSAIGNANTALTADDLTKITTFSATTLTPGSPVVVTATIAVGNATASIDINVTRLQSDQDKANAIKDKITNTDLTVPRGTFVSAINPDTVTAIKRALKSENESLTADDLTKISWGDTAISPAGTPKNIAATITVGSGMATINLKVTIANSDQQEANAIAQEITVLDYDITAFSTAPADINTNDAYIRGKIVEGIIDQNPVPESALSIQTGAQLILRTPVAVTVLISVGGSSPVNKLIMVTAVPFGG